MAPTVDQCSMQRTRNLKIDTITHICLVPPLTQAAASCARSSSCLASPAAGLMCHLRCTHTEARRRVRIEHASARAPHAAQPGSSASAGLRGLAASGSTGQRPAGGELPAVTSQTHTGNVTVTCQRPGRWQRTSLRGLQSPLCSDAKLPGPNRQALASVECGTAIYHHSATGVLDDGDDNDC